MSVAPAVASIALCQCTDHTYALAIQTLILPVPLV
jgi:hypothetical protein